MRDRESNDHRERHQYQRFSGSSGHGERQRHEQHEADFKKNWKTNDQPGEHHGPWQTLFARDFDECPCNAVRAARLCEHLA